MRKMRNAFILVLVISQFLAAVSVTPGPVPKTGKPHELFHLTLPASITEEGIARAGTGSLPLWQNVDRDGRRFAFVVPARTSP